jgi:hypothetical protein
MEPSTDSDRATGRGGRKPLAADAERLNVHVAPSAMNALREVAEFNGVTLTEATRWAIRLLKLVDDARRDGVEIHFVDPRTDKTRVLELI